LAALNALSMAATVSAKSLSSRAGFADAEPVRLLGHHLGIASGQTAAHPECSCRPQQAE